jgi:hypothetical protein
MRVTSRVPPVLVGIKDQAQVLSGLLHISHWFTWREWTLKAVRSDTVSGGRHGDQLADLKVLQRGDDGGRARAGEVVEQVVTVETGAQAAGLDQPRPDLTGRCGDCDRPGRAVLGRWPCGQVPRLGAADRLTASTGEF